jgi:isopentenyl-diphosphate Delta-isomerase
MAEPANEIFDLVDDSGNIIGSEKRSIVHAKGLLHRAVYVWVFNRTRHLLIQQRAALKSIGPNLWDLSVAEHLTQGETYLQAAIRGLSEELGIKNISPDALIGPLGPPRRQELHHQVGDKEFHDIELVQSYMLINYDGEVSLDDGEVSDTKWVGVEDLRKEVEVHVDQYSPWMIAEGSSFGWKFQF